MIVLPALISTVCWFQAYSLKIMLVTFTVLTISLLSLGVSLYNWLSVLPAQVRTRRENRLAFIYQLTAFAILCLLALIDNYRA